LNILSNPIPDSAFSPTFPAVKTLLTADSHRFPLKKRNLQICENLCESAVNYYWILMGAIFANDRGESGDSYFVGNNLSQLTKGFAQGGQAALGKPE
jgi:hypothetical protein